MTLTMDAGKYGAKTQTLHGGNPRAVLKRLMDENPQATEDDLLPLLLDAISEDDYRAIVAYWLTNNRKSIMAEQYQPPPPKPVEREEQTQKQRAAVEKLKAHIKAKAVEMVLLDLALPGGKMLRDSTGRECAAAGGWFTRIAAKVGPKQVVGKVLSEGDVRAIWKEAA